jgi:hypothetical protein
LFRPAANSANSDQAVDRGHHLEPSCFPGPARDFDNPPGLEEFIRVRLVCASKGLDPAQELFCIRTAFETFDEFKVRRRNAIHGLATGRRDDRAAGPRKRAPESTAEGSKLPRVRGLRTA